YPARVTVVACTLTTSAGAPYDTRDPHGGIAPMVPVSPARGTLAALATFLFAGCALAANAEPADAQRRGPADARTARTTADTVTPPAPGEFPMPDSTQRMHIVAGTRHGPSAFPLSNYEQVR